MSTSRDNEGHITPPLVGSPYNEGQRTPLINRTPSPPAPPTPPAPPALPPSLPPPPPSPPPPPLSPPLARSVISTEVDEEIGSDDEGHKQSKRFGNVTIRDAGSINRNWDLVQSEYEKLRKEGKRVPVLHPSGKKQRDIVDMFNSWLSGVDDIMIDYRRFTWEAKYRFIKSVVEGSVAQFMRDLDLKDRSNWDTLKDVLKKKYLPGDIGRDAELELFNLRQYGSLDDYNDEHRRLWGIMVANNKNETVEGLLARWRARTYINGLRDSEVRRCVLSKTSTEFLVAELEARLTTSALEQRRVDKKRSYHRSNENARSNDNGSSGSFTKRNKLTETERAKLMSEGRCLKCRKTGHIARECPERDASLNTNRQ